MHYKYIQWNFYISYGCPNFHCTVLIQVQWENVNTDLQWFTVVICMANTCNLYTSFTSVTVSTVYICSVLYFLSEKNFKMITTY